MLKIISMELAGFKSFYNRTKINFEEPINIIVGPNGCGKSNICDAFRWVLGEQKGKALRTQKMEDVIFAGSEKYKPVGMAEVSIKLKSITESNEENIEVKRRLFRDGKSEYFLNGKRCRLKDIHEFFEGTGLGFSPYAIIEQGEISTLISMKPLEKRELIEEAAKIISFKNRKKSALLKLELSEKNLYRVKDIISEIEKNLRSLKIQAGKAKKYLQYKSLKRNHLKFYIREKVKDLLAKMEDLESKLYNLEEKIEGEEENLKTIQMERDGLAKKIKETTIKITSLSDLKNSLKNENSQILTGEKYKKEKIENNKKRIEKIRGEIFESTERLNWLKDQLEEKERKLEELKEKFFKMKEKFKDEESNFKSLLNREKEIKEKIEEKKGTITSLESKRINLNNELIVNGETIKNISREKERIEKDIKSINNTVEELDIKSVHLIRKKEKVEEEMDELNAQRDEYTYLLEELESKILSLKGELNSLRGEKEGLKHKINTLLQLEANRDFYSKETKQILKKIEGLSGFRGILSDFINPGEKYVELIESFMSSYFDTILIKSEKVEEIIKNIENLETKALLSIPCKKKVPKSKITGEKILGKIKDFLIIDPKFNPYLENYLTDLFETTIVKDLKTALKLYEDYPHEQFLTESGILIGKNGMILINGESNKGILSFRKEKRDLEKREKFVSEKIEEIEGMVFEYESKREDLFIKKEECEERLSQLKVEFENLKREIEENKWERKRLSKRLDFFNQESSRLEKEKNMLEEKRRDLSQRVEKISKTLEEAKKKIAENMEELKKIGNEIERRRESFYISKNDINSMEKEMGLLKDVINQFKEQMESRKRSIEKFEREANSLKSEITLIEAELESENKKYHKNKVKIEEIERELTRIIKQKNVLENKLILREREIGECRKHLDFFKEEKNEIELKLIEVKGEIKNNEVICETELNMGINEILHEEYSQKGMEEKGMTPQEAYEKYLFYKEKILRMGSINHMAIEEYEKERKRLEFNLKQKEDIEESIQSTKEAISEMEKKSLREFLKTFKEVNKNFKETFKELFGGGYCQLKLIDEENPLESGVDIVASPPGKKLQNIMLLSGGEKALTALALLIALFKYRPAPFCILDEVDAPLDDANVDRFLKMVEKLTSKTQFIIMTHNRKTMEIGKNIYGITMEEAGISKVVSIKLKGEKKLVS